MTGALQYRRDQRERSPRTAAATTLPLMTTAPERFVEWMSTHTATDKKHGRKVYRYHPRSDEHSKKLCQLVLDDLLRACPVLADHAKRRIIVGEINAKYVFANGKVKNLDLALGTPADPVVEPVRPTPIMSGRIASLRVSIEAKQCMTEHSKSKPRIFDELSSSHEIVHQGAAGAVAAGIVAINIASRFASPLRQKNKRGPLEFTEHRQPAVAESMVNHLRGLKMSDQSGDVGFDAFATIVINCDNVGNCTLHTDAPAPQAGDPDHYLTFLQRICAAYAARFGAE